MKTSGKFVLVAFIAMIATTAVAQEWTKDQKEVWQTVKNTWEMWKAGDLEAAVAALHPKYQGWSSNMPLPMDKESIMQMFQSMKDIMKIESYQINPARIAVADNAAVVDYYFQFSATYTMGENQKHVKYHGKYVEFYVKEGGKWLLLGDMTVYDPEKE